LNTPQKYNSLDDLLFATYNEIILRGSQIKGKRGKIFEVINFSATLTNPRVRTSMSLDRKLVKSKFAEFAWYLSKNASKDYITPYITAYNEEEEENSKILGAYGPKIFGNIDAQKSQFERIIDQISERTETKQAYLSISENTDYKLRLEKFKSPPCTIGLHFIVREERLCLTAYMRSNDAYFGLPHDLFCFTMLQELVALRIGLKLGTYTHTVTSMHIYDHQVMRVKKYINEGLQESIEMPHMNDCSEKTLNLVSTEFDDSYSNSHIDELTDYWKDYVLYSHKNNISSTDPEKWTKKFQDNKMKRIATCSIAK